MNKENMKKIAALKALDYIKDDMIVGVGSGSTVHYFIEALANIKARIKGTVASSDATAIALKKYGIPVYDLNTVDEVNVYIDGADEVNKALHMIKGGGGALTREKIIAQAAKQFICIADKTKQVDILGHFPLPIEVIPMARSLVARSLLTLGGSPSYREGIITDNGNIILDVHHLDISNPLILENSINNIVGVVCHGIFAKRPADLLLLADEENCQVISAAI